MIRFKLDGNIVANPDGWQNLNTKIKRDDLYNALLIFQESEVEFIEDGYDYLLQKFNEGFCNVIEVIIEETCDNENNWLTLIKGNIFISDCEFNERTGKAKAKIEDNSFFSSIKNNLKIKTALNTDITKNKLPIQAIPVYDVDFYDIATNTNIVKNNVPCARIYDVFKYLISFMSDNKVGFESSLFGFGGKWEGLCITTGERIRTSSEIDWQPLSFEKVFKEVVGVTEPLIMIIEDPYNVPKIRIENIDYTYANNLNLLIENVYEITSSVEVKKIYSSIVVGSSDLDDTNVYDFPENIDYFGFKSEQFYFLGDCNIENELDLSGEFIRSSNVIQKQLTLQDNDKDTFFIDTILSSAFSGRTTNTNVFNNSPAFYYYNDRIRNSEILTRYIGGLPNNIIKYIGKKGDNTFKAQSNSLANYTFTPTTALQFTDEVFDNNNCYDGTDTFTALTAGKYNLYFESIVRANLSTAAFTEIKPFFKLYDQSNTLLNTFYGSTYVFSPLSANDIRITLNKNIQMNVGDYVQCFIEWDIYSGLDNLDVYVNAIFQCGDNTIGGGTFQIIDPKDFPVINYDFEVPLSSNNFNTILNNTSGKIGFNMQGQAFRYGWIKEINYNHIDKKASLKLITSQSNAY